MSKPKRKRKPTCRWTYDENLDMYETACGQGWAFTEGGLKDNKVRYCYHCGRVVEEVKGHE
jgi:hypothetical protein